jgi:hypothetical protein
MPPPLGADSASPTQQPGGSAWDAWLSERLASLSERRLLRALRPVVPTDNPVEARTHSRAAAQHSLATLAARGLRAPLSLLFSRPPCFPRSRVSLPAQVVVPRETMAAWLAGAPSTGECSVQPGDPPPAVRACVCACVLRRRRGCAAGAVWW